MAPTPLPSSSVTMPPCSALTTLKKSPCRSTKVPTSALTASPPLPSPYQFLSTGLLGPRCKKVPVTTPTPTSGLKAMIPVCPSTSVPTMTTPTPTKFVSPTGATTWICSSTTTPPPVSAACPCSKLVPMIPMALSSLSTTTPMLNSKAAKMKKLHSLTAKPACSISPFSTSSPTSVT